MGNPEQWELWERRRRLADFASLGNAADRLSFDVLKQAGVGNWAVRFREQIVEVCGEVSGIKWDRRGNPYFRVSDGDEMGEGMELWHLRDGFLPGISVRFRSISAAVGETRPTETEKPFLYGTATTGGFSRVAFLGDQVYPVAPEGRICNGFKKIVIFEQKKSVHPNFAYLGRFDEKGRNKYVLGVNGVLGEHAERITPVGLFKYEGVKKLLYVTESGGVRRIVEWDEIGERVLYSSKQPISDVVIGIDPSTTLCFLEGYNSRFLPYDEIRGTRPSSSNQGEGSGRASSGRASFALSPIDDDGAEGTLVLLEENTGSWVKHPAADDPDFHVEIPAEKGVEIPNKPYSP